MPKETFFNLPEEKRQNIYNIAIDEFSNKPYEKVSISQIVSRAKIAKGSFYQYFEDKEDLYTYLIDMIGKEKIKFMEKDFDKIEDMDFFEFMRYEYYCMSIFS